MGTLGVEFRQSLRRQVASSAVNQSVYRRSSNLAVIDTFDSTTGNFVSSSLLTVPGTKFSWAQTAL